MAWHPFRNPGLKIAALGLGTLLWITVSGQQVERSTVVQLQFRNVPSNLELTGDTPPTVNVRLRGASGQISALEPGQVVATIDLTDAKQGPRVFPLTADHISVPLGIEVKSVEPATVSVVLEPSKTTQVVVKPATDGDPAAGFDVLEVSAEPRTVTVVGPASRLVDHSNLSAITERISIEGAKTTVTETVSVAVSDPSVRLLDPRPVRVTIRIGPAPPTQFSNQRIVFRNLAAGRQAVADPPVVNVTVRGRREALASLPDHALAPYIDVSGRGPGRYSLPVHLESTDDYVVANLEPSTVTVRIR